MKQLHSRPFYEDIEIRVLVCWAFQNQCHVKKLVASSILYERELFF